jgi:hypothetical protein
LQLYPPKNTLLDGTARGGFVRKMKLGICMGRITGVCADENTQEREAMRRGKRILPILKGRAGFQGPHPEVRVRGSIAHTAMLDQVKIRAKRRPGKGALIPSCAT